MDRREKIKLTLQRIKIGKKLVARQIEFIHLAKTIGYEPVHAAANLQKFRGELSDQRKALIELTRSDQKNVPRPSPLPSFAPRKAA
jgi:hypothetical protein